MVFTYVEQFVVVQSNRVGHHLRTEIVQQKDCSVKEHKRKQVAKILPFVPVLGFDGTLQQVGQHNQVEQNDTFEVRKQN